MYIQCMCIYVYTCVYIYKKDCKCILYNTFTVQWPMRGKKNDKGRECDGDVRVLPAGVSYQSLTVICPHTPTHSTSTKNNDDNNDDDDATV